MNLAEDPATALDLVGQLQAARQTQDALESLLAGNRRQMRVLEAHLKRVLDIQGAPVTDFLRSPSRKPWPASTGDRSQTGLSEHSLPFSDSPPFGPLDFMNSTDIFDMSSLGNLPVLEDVPPLTLPDPLGSSPWTASADPSRQHSASYSSYVTSLNSSPTLSPFIGHSLDALTSPLTLPIPDILLPSSILPAEWNAGCPQQGQTHQMAWSDPTDPVAPTRGMLDAQLGSSGIDISRQAASQSVPADPAPALYRSYSSQKRKPRSASTSALRFSPFAAHLPVSPSSITSHNRAKTVHQDSRDTSSSAHFTTWPNSSSAPPLSTLVASPSAVQLPITPPDRDSLSRASSAAKRSRVSRKLMYDASIPIVKNSQHLFAIHTQISCKVEVSEKAVLTLVLADDTSADLPLARAAFADLPYTATMFLEDCRYRNVYIFLAPSDKSTWTVSFSQFGPQASPVTSDIPLSSPSPIYTFVHFQPGDLVMSPKFSMGSRQWWRLQECQQVHLGFPGPGHWTCRYDDPEEQEQRRPVRVVSHFASCPAASGIGPGSSWSLSTLAKAVLNVLPSD